jgi:hypothetical protein
MALKRILLALMALVALIAVGCSAGGAPKAGSPEAKFDFGDIPTTADMQYHDFVIRNDGASDLKIGDVQVKLLEGC